MFVEDLNRHASYKTVRWDIAGDFYDQTHLDLVYAVARYTPDRHHYTANNENLVAPTRFF